MNKKELERSEMTDKLAKEICLIDEDKVTNSVTCMRTEADVKAFIDRIRKQVGEE